MEEYSKKQLSSLRKYMHPRNPYKMPPSFKKLSFTYKEFRNHCTIDGGSGKVYLDFKNPAALASLTTCLLDQDFNLKVEIPPESLVPTLPLRFNYLLWIEDLLALIHPGYSDDNHKNIIGFDIGSGASCIYPLLGVKHFDWNFIATESNGNNFRNCQENTSRNEMQDRITLLNTDDKTFFEVLDTEDIVNFCSKIKKSPEENENKSDEVEDSKNRNRYIVDFTMCNPPFYSCEDEANVRRKDSCPQPSNGPTGSSHERIVDGGECAFIGKIISSSCQYKDKVRIFSTLIGRKKDLKEIKKTIENTNVAHYKFTEFCQGHTMRWGLAWTFDKTLILEKNFSKKEKACTKPVVFPIPRTCMGRYDIKAVWNLIQTWMREIKIKPRLITMNNYHVLSIIKAYKPTWQNQRQKRRQIIQEKRTLERKRKFSDVEEEDCIKRTRAESEESIDEDELSKGESSTVSIDSENYNTSQTNDNKESADSINDRKVSKNSFDEVSIQMENATINSPQKAQECLLKCNLSLNQVNGAIQVELLFLSGSSGKEGANQLMQFIKNKVKKPKS